MKRPVQWAASVLLAGLLLSGVISTVSAEESAGMVVVIRGTVNADGASGSRPLAQGDKVYIGESIVTEAKSFAVIQFVDGTKVTIRPGSEMAVEDYVYTGNGDEKATLNLVEGGLRIITGAITKTNPDAFRLRTPVALLGVRGTEFSVMLCKDDECETGDVETTVVN